MSVSASQRGEPSTLRQARGSTRGPSLRHKKGKLMSKSDKRMLPGQVLVRLPAAVALRIAALAAAEGTSGASWSRRHLVAAAAADPSDVVRIAARALPSKLAPAAILELVRLREVVAELSGSMTKAAVMVRHDGVAVLHAEIESILHSVKSAVLDLDALKKAILAGSMPP